MKRREFISLIVGATAWPLGARAQQPAMPVIAFLSPVPAAEAISHLIAAFRQGLAEAGFHDGENVAIEYRFTNFKPELMQQAASDVVRRKVNVIYAQLQRGCSGQECNDHHSDRWRRFGERSRCHGICQKPRAPWW